MSGWRSDHPSSSNRSKIQRWVQKMGDFMTNVARYKKFRQHRNHARTRGIPWEITYMQWSLIWARSGHWYDRGKGLGKYCMARFGDKGPYASWNVKIILHSENVSEGQLGNQYNLGRKLSLETRAKMSAAKMGRKLSLETRAKMSAALKGIRNPMFGKKHSPETRARMSAAQCVRREMEPFEVPR